MYGYNAYPPSRGPDQYNYLHSIKKEACMIICYRPIGVLHCDIGSRKDIPAFFSTSDVAGWIDFYNGYEDVIRGLDGVDRIIVLFYFHLSKSYSLLQKRRRTGELKGVFSLRSPDRPNAIGLSVLKLKGLTGSRIFVEGLDMVDGSPILDIWPIRSDPGKVSHLESG
ncbi:MAG: tRNA (N6-threonylcarbamoyladenosine(37)-N6)-methyltransferase TrmO [Deltaproteobacteria bacterium]|nr:MAG: tRNA (N6-threonylcarbamoyladenosine(37)-N6)-methyltransferase TrmO [Deltaproteobacteria bacterium]